MANLGADRDKKCSRTSKKGEIRAGGRKQAPIVSTPEFLPGSRCYAEYFIHLISFNPHLSKVWVIPFFIDWKTGSEDMK